MLCVSPNGSNYLTTDTPPLQLAVATIDGIRFFNRDSASAAWSLVGVGLAGSHVSSILYDVSRGVLVAGTHGQGLHRSHDGGKTWERIAHGVASDNIFCVASARQQDETVLYAGLEPVSIIRSDDLGRTWIRLTAIEAMPQRKQWSFPEAPFLAHVKFIAADPRNGSVLYACVEQGALLKSEDGGDNWRELADFSSSRDPIFRDIHRINFSPENPDHLWMMTGNGMFRSFDAGETWTNITGLDFRVAYPDHVVISKESPETIFVAGAIAHPGTWHLTGAAEGAVVRSHDGGKTWSLLSQSIFSDARPNIEAMGAAHYPGGTLLVIGDTDGGITASEDEGNSWIPIDRGAPISKSLHFGPVQPRRAGPPPAAPKPALADA